MHGRIAESSLPTARQASVLRASVIVCTRNRSRLVARCVDSLVAQVRPGDDVEILVVDNGSTDGTAHVVRAAQDRCAALHHILEPELGVSHARNRAIRDARGEVLLFIDDDATAHDGWLAAILAGFEHWPVSAIAGPIRLDVEGPRPRWMIGGVMTMFGHLDLGDAPRLLSSREGPFGANMAVRRDVAAALGGFQADLGRVGMSLISNEELEFFTRLERCGGSIAYLPDAVVTHLVHRGRATLRFLVRSAFAQGRSDARLHAHLVAGGGSWLDSRIARAFARCLLRGWRRSSRSLVHGPDRCGVVAQELAHRSGGLGFASEQLRLRLQARPSTAGQLPLVSMLPSSVDVPSTPDVE